MSLMNLSYRILKVVRVDRVQRYRFLIIQLHSQAYAHWMPMGTDTNRQK